MAWNIAGRTAGYHLAGVTGANFWARGCSMKIGTSSKTRRSLVGDDRAAKGSVFGRGPNGNSRHETDSKDDRLVGLARCIDLSALVWTLIRVDADNVSLAVDADNVSLAEVKRQHKRLSFKFVYTLLDQSTKKNRAIIQYFPRLVNPKTSIGGHVLEFSLDCYLRAFAKTQLRGPRIKANLGYLQADQEAQIFGWRKCMHV